MTISEQAASDNHAAQMDRMYRYQRHVYDLTRKYYLFGRDSLIGGLDLSPGQSILEVGCGTGRNMAVIGARYPKARLFGLDISAEMLVTAKAKLAGRGGGDPVLRVADATHFRAADFGQENFDRIIISYALSMIPDWQSVIDSAVNALAPDGSLNIVDFGQQEGLPSLFRRGFNAWLQRFHVTPRANLPNVMEDKATRHGAVLVQRRIGRGYAWIFVLKMSAGSKTL